MLRDLENAINKVMPDAFSRLITETEFLILVIRIKFVIKNASVNDGNKILIGNFHKNV